MHAPSAGNLQPWNLHVLWGEQLRRFKDQMSAKFNQRPAGEGCEFDVIPPEIKEPFRSRRDDSSEAIYTAVGIPRSNRTARLIEFGRNFDFFGAPDAIFVCIDRQMGSPQWIDLGMP